MENRKFRTVTSLKRETNEVNFVNALACCLVAFLVLPHGRVGRGLANRAYKFP